MKNSNRGRASEPAAFGERFSCTAPGPMADCEQIGLELASRLLADCGEAILEQILATMSQNHDR